MTRGSFFFFLVVFFMQTGWHICACGKKPKKEKYIVAPIKPAKSKVGVPGVTPVASVPPNIVSPKAPKKSTKLSAEDPVSAHTNSKKLLSANKNAKKGTLPPLPVLKPKQSKRDNVPEPSKTKPAKPEEVKVVKTIREEEKSADGKNANAPAPVIDNPYVTEVTDEFPTVEETKEASLKDSKKGSKKDKKALKTDCTQD